MVNGLTSLRQKLKKGNHSVHKVDTFGIRGDTPSPRHSLASPFVVNTQKVKEKNDRRRKDGSRPLMNQRMDSWDQYMANQQAGEASRRLQTITAPEVPQRRRTVLTRPGRLSLGSERDENPYDGSRAAQRSVPPTFNKGIPEGHVFSPAKQAAGASNPANYALKPLPAIPTQTCPDHLRCNRPDAEITREPEPTAFISTRPAPPRSATSQGHCRIKQDFGVHQIALDATGSTDPGLKPLSLGSQKGEHVKASTTAPVSEIRQSRPSKAFRTKRPATSSGCRDRIDVPVTDGLSVETALSVGSVPSASGELGALGLILTRLNEPSIPGRVSSQEPFFSEITPALSSIKAFGTAEHSGSEVSMSVRTPAEPEPVHPQYLNFSTTRVSSSSCGEAGPSTSAHGHDFRSVRERKPSACGEAGPSISAQSHDFRSLRQREREPTMTADDIPVNFSPGGTTNRWAWNNSSVVDLPRHRRQRMGWIKDAVYSASRRLKTMSSV